MTIFLEISSNVMKATEVYEIFDERLPTMMGESGCLEDIYRLCKRVPPVVLGQLPVSTRGAEFTYKYSDLGIIDSCELKFQCEDAYGGESGSIFLNMRDARSIFNPDFANESHG